MHLGMINSSLERQRILSRRYVFFALSVETGVETTPSAYPRGLQEREHSDQSVLPGSS